NQLGNAAIPGPLRDMCLGFSEPTCFPVFGTEALQGIATDQWIWMNIAKKENLIPYAPLLWEGFGGQRISKEFWQVSPYFLDAKGNIEEAAEAFDLDEECYLRDLLAPLARKYKLEVQVLDGRFFFARKTAWKIEVCPWKAQLHQKPQPVFGEDKSEFEAVDSEIKNLLQGSELNQYRKENDRQEVQGLWISGGGFDTAIKDVSFTRVVQTNSVLVKGICKSCGIANNFVTPEGAPWPAECPEGDRLSICTDFLDPAVKKDKRKWIDAWEKIRKHVENHLTTAKGIENLELFNPVLVATDGLRVSTITKSLKKSFFPMFGKKQDFSRQWICPKD
ncbi:hypothetical protein, partial [Turicimonas muris]